MRLNEAGRPVRPATVSGRRRTGARGLARRSTRRVAALFVTGAVTAGFATALAQPATADGPDYMFVVNSTADAGDQNPGDGNCYDNLVRCTLRAAIEEANALQQNNDDHLIVDVDFAIPGTGPHVISPATHFPVSLSSIQLLATTQPGYSPGHPLIEIDGSHADSLAGFYILGDGSAVEGFDIHDFYVGVYLATGSGGIGFDTVSGNFIGTDVTGQTARGNWVGVYDAAPSSTVGGDTPAERNVISGNGEGVQVASAGYNSWVIGNYIGTNAAGTEALAPLTEDHTVNDLGWGAGVDINSGATGVHVGGTNAGYGNLISQGTDGQAPPLDYDDGVDGVRIGSFAPGQPITNEISVQGNLIGTDATGTRALGNQVGVALEPSAYGSTIGGISSAARNVISGNRDWGIQDVSRAGATSIVGNYIGTDIAGTSALGNGGGVFAYDDDGMIGSSSVLLRYPPNVISGNLHDGIDVQGEPSDGLPGVGVVKNVIGMDSSGQHLLGNGGDGLRVSGHALVSDDMIAGNGGNGVNVTGSQGVDIRGGSIHDNGKLGIDLGDDGVTANDVGDADGVQNFPLITQAQQSADGAYTIEGTLNSKVNDSIRIQVYQSDTCDSSGNGEGRSLVGTASLLTDDIGNGTFTVVGVYLAGGGALSATATGTSPSLGTSEFSPCFERTPPTVTIDNTDPDLLNATRTGSAVSWHADRDGTLRVEVGGDSCGRGTLVEAGPYAESDGEHVTTVPAAALAEGDNTVRVCLADTFGNTGAATTTIKKDSIAPAVTIDASVPAVINASTSSTALTWHADEAGTYVVRAGGDSCGSGNAVASGNYSAAGSSHTTAVSGDSLAEGANTLRICVTDAAGNPGSAATSVLKDTVAPTVTPNHALDTCDQPGNAGWCLHQVTAGFTALDATSGVATPCESTAGGSCTYLRTTTTNGSAVTIASGPVCDAVGNCTADTSSTGPFQLDSGVPTLAPTLPGTILLNEEVSVDPHADDPLVNGFASGIATSSCELVDTSTAGAHTITCSAADVAGNTAEVTVRYVVAYEIDGFFSPVPSSKWHRWQTVPIKIALTDVDGVRIPDSEAESLVDSPCRVLFSASGAQSAGPSCFRYDVTNHQFVYAWSLGPSGTGTETVTATVAYPGTTATTTKSETVKIT